MNTRTLLTALAGFSLIGALALTGCAGSPPSTARPAPNGQASDAASRFLACLTSAGVEAKINDQGMVLVKDPTAVSEGPGGSISTDSGGAESMMIESDEAGNAWAAPANADYFADDPNTQDAYAACEKAHPDFSQPQFDPTKDPEFTEMLGEQQEAALAFARCARENGYAEIADPDAGAMGGSVMIPSGFTEDDFRALIEVCYDPSTGFGFGSDENLGFEPWTILEEFQNAPAS
ncbi:MAG: hypothetical protein ACK5LO_02910 [Leucobacter sp.]